MAGSTFLDTNIILYAYSFAGRRTEQAERLLLEGGIVSVQVLNEFVSGARKKLRMEWTEVRTAIQRIVTQCPNPRPLSFQTHEAAFRICERYGFSIYDGTMIASALEAGCKVLCTEDLQHGQVIDGLRIQNPFLDK